MTDAILENAACNEEYFCICGNPMMHLIAKNPGDKDKKTVIERKACFYDLNTLKAHTKRDRNTIHVLIVTIGFLYIIIRLETICFLL